MRYTIYILVTLYETSVVCSHWRIANINKLLFIKAADVEGGNSAHPSRFQISPGSQIWQGQEGFLDSGQGHSWHGHAGCHQKTCRMLV
jgi:hypothetical protein